MATLGIGVDIVSVERIAAALARTDGFLERVYTEFERAACMGLEEKTRHARLAARFAAKEAFYKALGPNQKGLSWQDVGVVSERGEPPRLEPSESASNALTRLGASRALLSLSHDGGLAIAMVVLEG